MYFIKNWAASKIQEWEFRLTPSIQNSIVFMLGIGDKYQQFPLKNRDFCEYIYHHLNAKKVVFAFWSICRGCHFVFKFFFFFLTVFSFLISSIKIAIFQPQIWTKSWIVYFTYIFQIKRKLNFDQNADMFSCIHMMINGSRKFKIFY